MRNELGSVLKSISVAIAIYLFASPAFAIPFLIQGGGSPLYPGFHLEDDLGSGGSLTPWEISFDAELGEDIVAVEDGAGSFQGMSGDPVSSFINRRETFDIEISVTSGSETISLDAGIFWTADNRVTGVVDGELRWDSQDDIDLTAPLVYEFSFGTLTITYLNATVPMFNTPRRFSALSPVDIRATLEPLESSVPVPGALALLGIGLVGLGLKRRASAE